MKTFGLKKLLPILIPLFLTLATAAPRLTPQSLFGPASEGQSVLVYSFVWVPLLEVSMMIAQRILPAQPDQAARTDKSPDAAASQQAPTTDHAYSSLPVREPLILKEFRLDATVLSHLIAVSPLPAALPCSPRPAQLPGILLLVSLVFLCKSLLPRSDVPRLTSPL